MRTKTNFKNYIHPLSIKICDILTQAGYEAYLVGGCVRDLILGEEPKDWDITTNALPEKIIELFPKTYPTGLQHGTVTVAMENEHFEVTTFRVEGEYLDGRRPETVCFVNDIIQDLSRRDLTINSMAYDPINNKLIDPFDGIKDLENGIIKAVGNPNLRFQEDGLRIMRTVRFAARFGFKIDPETLTAMSNNLNTLNKVSKERINDELCKILKTKHDVFGIKILFDSKVLELICPILLQTPIVYQNNCPGDLETKLAYLYCGTEIDLVKKELTNLKFSNKEIKKIIFLLNLMDRYTSFEKEIAYTNNKLNVYKQFIAYVKNNTLDTYEYTMEQLIKLYNVIGFDITDKLAKYHNEIVFARNEMQINGDDLLAIGIPSGPEIKKILDMCYQEIIDNPENNEHYKLLKLAMFTNINETK